MADHATYFSYPLSNLYHSESLAQFAPEIERFAFGVLLAGGLVLLGKALSSKVMLPAGNSMTAVGENASAVGIIPSKKLSLAGIADAFLELFTKIYDSFLGDPERRHLSFVFSIFVFLLFSNLLGLVPGMPAITNTVWVNVGLALVVFIYFNVQGIKENGLAGYLKHFCGPFWWLAPFFFAIEILSTCLRVLTLNLRLYWNIKADHMVLDVFTDLLGFGVPVVFYLLGTFVCLMQAFIFTALTMVYILLATQHGDEH